MNRQTVEAAAGPAVALRGLKVHFPLRPAGLRFWEAPKVIKAVDGVDLTVENDEMFGLAGESGCGKSTIARVLIGLTPPTHGEVRFQGQSLPGIDQGQLRTRIQMVFQDPYGSLNPRRTIADIVGDPLVVHKRLPRAERLARIEQALQQVGLAGYHMNRFPHEFSGGQRQRVAIARALILNPGFLVLDEPTSALDVSVQAIILNLISKLREERRLGCLFITHDLNLMRFMTTRLAVMYLGRIVETGETADIFKRPLHPYTRALIASTPVPKPGRRAKDPPLRGELPSPVKPPTGCPFHTRCRDKIGRVCETAVPPLAEVEGRMVACHLHTPPARHGTGGALHAC